jgi:hypothetical protein
VVEIKVAAISRGQLLSVQLQIGQYFEGVKGSGLVGEVLGDLGGSSPAADLEADVAAPAGSWDRTGEALAEQAADGSGVGLRGTAHSVPVSGG